MNWHLPVHEIAAALRTAIISGARSRVLLKAPTGSGKSTTVPGMLLDAGIPGMILVIQPRRMAARLHQHAATSHSGRQNRKNHANG